MTFFAQKSTTAAEGMVDLLTKRFCYLQE